MHSNVLPIQSSFVLIEYLQFNHSEFYLIAMRHFLVQRHLNRSSNNYVGKFTVSTYLPTCQEKNKGKSSVKLILMKEMELGNTVMAC